MRSILPDLLVGLLAMAAMVLIVLAMSYPRLVSYLLWWLP